MSYLKSANLSPSLPRCLREGGDHPRCPSAASLPARSLDFPAQVQGYPKDGQGDRFASDHIWGNAGENAQCHQYSSYKHRRDLWSQNCA